MERKNTIRTYQNSIFIEFKEIGDSFTLNVPHYKEWINLISFLKRRGFAITQNSYYVKHAECLSKYHKFGVKNNVHLLMEIYNSGMKLEFGNERNLWDDTQSFWSYKSNKRYSPTTYLEDKAVQLEILKTLNRFKEKGFIYLPNSNDRNDIEEIIYDNNQNKHIHGEIACLDDIGRAIKKDSYNYNQNSWDKNKKRLTCGDIKCFYDYSTRRIFMGKAYHNINNMWWVIVNGKRYNKVSFDLFDYDSSLPKRKPLSENEKTELFKSLINKYSDELNFERCITLRNYAKSKFIL